MNKLFQILKSKWARLVLALFAIPGVVAYSLFEMDRNGFFNVDQLRIIVVETPEAPQYLKPWMKSLDSKLEIYRGRSLWKIDLNEVSRQIMSETWIEDVQLSRRFPSDLNIAVRPKEVHSLLMTKAGPIRPVVNSGEMLEPVDLRESPDLPLMIGEVFEKNESLRKKAIAALKEIPEQGSFSRKSISEIRFDSRDGFWMTLVKSGIKVKIGEEKVGLKSERVSQVIDYIRVHDLQARVIDANLSKKVLVRLRKDP